MDLWRISEFNSLSGKGGLLYAARWNSVGLPIVYLAASPAGALLEVLVHLELTGATLPPSYTLLKVSAPDDSSITPLEVPRGEGWKSKPALTRKLGDTWLRSGASALARVPSAIVPDTSNFLFNPLHPGAAEIKIVASRKASYDPRLLRSLNAHP